MKLPTVPTVKIANLEEELDSENRLGATATSTVTTPNTQTPIWPRAETPQRTARLVLILTRMGSPTVANVVFWVWVWVS